MLSPWEVYRKELAAWFELDEDVEVSEVRDTETEGTYEVIVGVKTHDKATAIADILRRSIQFGNVTLNVNVNEANCDDTISRKLKTAFGNNRRVMRIMEAKDHTQTQHTFVILDPEVIQYFADNIGDYCGKNDEMANEVAKKIFDVGDEIVHFNLLALDEN